MFRGEFVFEASDLIVAGEARGKTYRLRKDDRLVEFRIPAAGYIFPPDDEDQAEAEEWRRLLGETRWVLSGVTGDKSDPGRIATSVRFIKVKVWADADLDASAVQARDKSETDKAIRLISELLATARTALQEWLLWARVTKWQPWLSRLHERPDRAGIASLIDESTGQRLPVGPPIGVVGEVGKDKAALEPEDLEEMTRKVERGDVRDLGSELIAEAGALFRSGELREAVLEAAIAAEVSVKRDMVLLAGPEARPVVDLLLESPRDYSLAAAALFDKGIVAVSGRSLRHDDAELNKSVQELFTLRNRVAHRGHVPMTEEARTAVNTARAALEWLASVVEGAAATRQSEEQSQAPRLSGDS